MNLAIIWIFKTHLRSINVCARTNIVLNIPTQLQNMCVSMGLTNNCQKISETKQNNAKQKPKHILLPLWTYYNEVFISLQFFLTKILCYCKEIDMQGTSGPILFFHKSWKQKVVPPLELSATADFFLFKAPLT